MPVDPEKYSWIADEQSYLTVAGCVTVVTNVATERLAGAFGVDPDGSAHDEDEFSPSVGITAVAGGQVAVEANGFEGNRPEVLGPASTDGRAASIFWNVDGMAMFSCADAGEVLCNIEFAFEQDPSLPDELMALRELADDESGETDLVAIGMAMVETFTGVELSPDDVLRGLENRRLLTPVVEKAKAPEHSRLHWDDEVLANQICAASSTTQRRLAEWAAVSAARQVSLFDDATVRGVTDQFGGTGVAHLTTEAEVLIRNTIREADASDWKWQDGEIGDFANEAMMSIRCFAEALRHACDEVALSGALGAVRSAGYSFIRARESFFAEASAMLRTEPSTWPPHATRVPEPLTPEERSAALAADRPRTDEWQILPSGDEDDEFGDWSDEQDAVQVMQADSPTQQLAQLDRDLANDLVRLPDPLLKDLTRWVIRRTLVEARLADLSWVSAALDAVEADRQLPPPFDQDRIPFHLLESDPDVEWTTAPNLEGGFDVSQQHMALPIFIATRIPDPLTAAVYALNTGAVTFGAGYPRLFAEVRSKFLT